MNAGPTNAAPTNELGPSDVLLDADRHDGGWPAVVAVTAATFTVVTSEMAPVGLLTPVADALRVSEGTAGLTLTATGLVAAVSSPFVLPALGRLDRRRALGGLMMILAVANVVSALAPHFVVLLAARVLVGLAMGGVWSLAGGLAVRLVPARAVGSATAMIFSGIAVASVLGVPAGTSLGELWGWRAAFAVFAILSLGVATALILVLPRLPVADRVHVAGVFRLLESAKIRTGLIIVALLVTGHFAAYTFIRPILEETMRAGPIMVGALLLIFGIAGIVGNFLAGLGLSRSLRGTIMVLAGSLALAVLLHPVVGGTFWGAASLMILWGLAYGGVSVSTQTWLLMAAPAARESATALFVAVFNGAIAVGAFTGGLVLDGWGVVPLTVVAGGLAVLALAATILGRVPGAGPGSSRR